MLENLYGYICRLKKIIRAQIFFYIGQPKFFRRGRGCKIFGWKNITVGQKVTIGDYCWIEGVIKYRSQEFKPEIVMGNSVSISDFTHISAVKKIHIGTGCLLGSKIYIGDHSHGNTKSPSHLLLPPGDRPLSNVDEIYIGKNTWIGDGAVILAGTNLAEGSIVAANSVVKLRVDRAAIVAGNPAIIIKYL